MFNKKFKLMATAVGLVAVLVMGLAMPGATQGYFSRQTFINALNSEITTLLTASVGDPLNLEATAFFSFARATSAYIPPHPSIWSARLFKNFVLGKVEAISLGAVYVAEDIPGVIAKGLYRIKALNRERVILLDQDGSIVLTRRIRWLMDPEDLASNPLFNVGDVTIEAGSTSYVASMPSDIDPGGGGLPLNPPPGASPPTPPTNSGISITITIRVGNCFGTGVQVCFGVGDVITVHL